MKHYILHNPFAGTGNKPTALIETLEASGKAVEYLDITSITDYASFFAGLREDDAVILCGGDGTINEVANGILGYDNAAMTCIPMGTGNDFLKNFGSDAALFADAENLWDQPTRQLDLIDCNGRAVLTIACSGVDARIASDVHHFSRLPFLTGKGSYIAAGSTVTEDVPEDALAVARARQVNKEEWAAKRREKNKK